MAEISEQVIFTCMISFVGRDENHAIGRNAILYAKISREYRKRSSLCETLFFNEINFKNLEINNIIALVLARGMMSILIYVIQSNLSKYFTYFFTKHYYLSLIF